MSTTEQTLLAAPPARARARRRFGEASTAAKITGIRPGAVHQLDLLSLPRDPDTGAIAALVVIDLASRAVDARPLKTKTAREVWTALQDIYRAAARNGRDSLKPPARIEIDGGGEFAQVKKESMKKGVSVRIALPGRHQQQKAVENANKMLVKRIMARQVAEELLTAADARHWVSDLEGFVKEINESIEQDPPEQELEDVYELAAGMKEANFSEMLNIGDLVRYQLDRPISVATGKPLAAASTSSGFREGDVRWSLDPVAVADVLYKPGQPIRYTVEGIDNVSYTRAQLKPVDPDERFPLGKKVIRGQPATYIPFQLHGRRKRNGRVEFNVEWRGFPEPGDYTWEPVAELKKSTVGRRLIERA